MEIGAPSSAPRLLHCVCEPLRHKMVARRIAKESLILIHLITSLYLFSHLSARQSAIFLKVFSLFVNHAINRATNWCKTCSLFKTSIHILSFFSFLAEITTSLEKWLPYDQVSMSVTCISNNATAWGYQTPRTVRSATNAGERFSSSASLMIGSHFTWLQAIGARSPLAFLTSVCLCNIKPPFLQINACSKLKGTLHLLHLAGIYCKRLISYCKTITEFLCSQVIVIPGKWYNS